MPLDTGKAQGQLGGWCLLICRAWGCARSPVHCCHCHPCKDGPHLGEPLVTKFAVGWLSPATLGISAPGWGWTIRIALVYTKEIPNDPQLGQCWALYLTLLRHTTCCSCSCHPKSESPFYVSQSHLQLQPLFLACLKFLLNPVSST